MKQLKVAIHSALRDDSAATVGLRALLGFNATPWGVYQGHFQDVPDFKSGKSVLTWQFLAGAGTGTGLNDMRLREQLFTVTAWSANSDTMEDVLSRARLVLDRNLAMILPILNVELHRVMFEGSGPDLFDDEHKVYHRAEHYRAYFREDLTTTLAPITTMGVAANKPAASEGTWYYSTDTGILEFSDGSAWHPVYTG